jgi:lambda family phage portal protein
VNNIIGEAGLTPRLPATMPIDLQRQALDLYKDWAGTVAIDVEGRHTFAGLQMLLQRSIIEGGETLVRFIPTDDSNLPLGLQLQCLEADHIDTTKDHATDTGRIINGVQFDADNRRIGYWLFKSHPGGSTVIGRVRIGQSVFIDASEILHPFRTDRLGQVRGVPWGAPIMLTLRDFDDFLDAQLLRQKIAACFVGFTHTLEAEVTETSGEGRDDVIELEPGTMEDLPAGKDIKFSKPPGVEDLMDYSRITLRQIAMGYGISYEALTGDLAGVNFSSGRMGHLEFQRETRMVRSQVIVPQLCQPVWERFVRFAEIQGIFKRNTIPRAVEWTGPRQEMIDPTKEVPAITRRIRSGQGTLSDELRRSGVADVRAHLEERAADDALLDELGLVLTSDPRQNVGSGDAGEASVGGTSEETSNRLARLGANGGARPPEERDE